MASLTVFGALFPILISLFQLNEVEPKIWSHMRSYVLPRAIGQTAFLILSVSGVTLFLGVACGWICSQYEFRGRSLIGRFLVIPLTIPAYVLAFVYLGLFDFAGEWRLWFFQYGLDIYLHGGWGACFVLSMSLYPYVYLFSLSAFSTQGRRWREVAQSLGRSKWSSFVSVEWLFCSPWIFSGLALVAMEVVADFGAVSMFNYETLSTSIYKVWFGMQSWRGASQLASFLLIFVLIVKILRFHRLQGREYISDQNHGDGRQKVPWWGQIFIYIFFGLLLGVALFIPLFQLIYWTISFSIENGWNFLGYVQHSFALGFLGALFISILSFFLSYGLRVNKNHRLCRWSEGIFYLGYTLPGTVLAVGVLGLSIYLWPSGQSSIFWSFSLLLLAYTIRFQALGVGQLSSAFQRLSPALDESAVLLEKSGVRRLWRLHFPLVHKAWLVSGLLIFIEIVKEMPLTLMLRPFGWNTLAVKIFEFTSEGNWEGAALPALMMALLGMVASWWIQTTRL